MEEGGKPDKEIPREYRARNLLAENKNGSKIPLYLWFIILGSNYEVHYVELH
jgi:hypothetical protein